jgi:DsbC/DsbD-like thiol-disulfide interchange protein
MVRAVSLILALLVLPSAAARAADASAWSDAKGGQMRLVLGNKDSSGHRMAGVEIKLEPGWKTYWRNPGDAGIPPRFDWLRSQNLGEALVAYPAPERLDENGSVSIGYTEDVIFPVRLSLKDPAAPLVLALTLDYAICKEICVPATGSATLEIGPDDKPAAGSAMAIEAHAARVPVSQPLGSGEALSVVSARYDKDAHPATVLVEVRAAGEPQLFVDGPPAWFLPFPKRVAVPAGDKATRAFLIPLQGLPEGEQPAGASLTFTLVAPEGAVETPYTIR